jgi:two-component system chemotaxis sensor kinase CheA
MGDREAFNLIFEPGFSTAKKVTDVSGRGVGMDVVKKNIESLRGQVEVRSEKGKGSVFKVILPLTLAIIDGMMVRVGAETYVIPTVSIVRSVKPQPGDISTVHNRGEMFAIQGNLIPLFRLDDLFRIEGAVQKHNEALVVVVEDGELQAGLLVNKLIGRQQVVMKTLGAAMRDIPGISGGAILPNGRVGLILDVGGLVRFATKGPGPGMRQCFCGAKEKVLAA